MAGDWIPIHSALPRKAEVLRIRHLTGLSRQQVLGLLIEFWIWADAESIDGTLPGLSVEALPSIWQVDEDFSANRMGGDSLATRCPPQGDVLSRFCRALITVGWLTETTQGLRLPNFERWMGKSAKRRLRQNLSKQDNRIFGRQNGDTMATSDEDKKETPRRPEKRREESNQTPNPLSGGEQVDDPREEEQLAFVAGQTLDQIKGVPVRDTISDRPDLLPIVDRVLAHYRRVCKPESFNLGLSRSAICKRLVQGHSEEKLTKAADRYAASHKGRIAVQTPQRFYGKSSGGYEGYAEELAPAPRPANNPALDLPPHDPAAAEILSAKIKGKKP